jgi:hypothetical protein
LARKVKLNFHANGAHHFCAISQRMSGHLIRPINIAMSPRDLAKQLRSAQTFLVTAARLTVLQLANIPADRWASAVKREYVQLAQANRPQIIDPNICEHSFAEVVNQCATLERLIDTLDWVETHPELGSAVAVTCNPTTSSAPRRKNQTRQADDHDLVLETPNRTRWRFEVADVASKNDGNKKEMKDLLSLGIPVSHDSSAFGWPTGRCFLVVSSEFSVRLRRHTRHGLRFGVLHYVEVKADGPTRIFEVRQGPSPTGKANGQNGQIAPSMIG